MLRTAYHTKDISNLRFLITGGAGFIGSNIVEYLLIHGAGKIRILDDLSTGRIENIRNFIDQGRVEFIKGTITDVGVCKEVCKNIDIILHQAALGSVPRSINNPLATHNVNATGFLNILSAAKEANIKRIVFASSSSVFGDSPDLPKKEEKLGKPLSPYAVSKLVNEQYAAIFNRIYGTETVGLRYFNIYGPRQNPKGEYAAAIPLFMDGHLCNREVFINGNGSQTRDFTFVENAVQANILAALTDSKEALGDVFNIAMGEKTSVIDLFNIIKELTGSGLQPKFRQERPGDVKDSLADISKAQRVLGYKPSIRIKEGLFITLEAFKKEFAS